ncbi:hypothetical protein EYB53_022960, partial [Candidatus Chloroploca sp. M-50]|nr:hypothetical protein [Candidatus Chloroploca mongolica]
MAEPESILQLGIEAAREGKKDEARQLFRLLTRQEPENAQGWLWLAGVAENREERQNALERVLTLDPQNEMAIKGLNALGVRPSTTMRAGIHEVPPPPPPPTEAITDDAFEDDPFAELDNLGDAISADTSGPVRRAEGVPHHADPQDEKLTADRAAMLAASSQRRRDEAEPAKSRRSAVYNDEYEEPRRGFSPLLALLLFLVGLGLVGLLLAFLFSDFFGGTQVAEPNATQQAIVAATATALAENPIIGVEPTTDPGDPGTDPGQPGTDPGQPGTDPGQPGTDPGQPGTDPGQ